MLLRAAIAGALLFATTRLPAAPATAVGPTAGVTCATAGAAATGKLSGGGKSKGSHGSKGERTRQRNRNPANSSADRGKRNYEGIAGKRDVQAVPAGRARQGQLSSARSPGTVSSRASGKLQWMHWTIRQSPPGREGPAPPPQKPAGDLGRNAASGPASERPPAPDWNVFRHAVVAANQPAPEPRAAGHPRHGGRPQPRGRLEAGDLARGTPPLPAASPAPFNPLTYQDGPPPKPRRAAEARRDEAIVKAVVGYRARPPAKIGRAAVRTDKTPGQGQGEPGLRIGRPVGWLAGKRVVPTLRPRPTAGSEIRVGNVDFAVVEILGEGTFGQVSVVRPVPQPGARPGQQVECVLKHTKVLEDAIRFAPREVVKDIASRDRDAQRAAREKWAEAELVSNREFRQKIAARLERQMRSEFTAQQRAFEMQQRMPEYRHVESFFARPLHQQGNQLLMERVKGVTLRDFAARLRDLHDQGKIRTIEKADVLRHITRQLTQAAHVLDKAGITHRDLNMKNVMVTASGRIKIIDFGAAVSPGETLAQRKEQGVAYGTSGFVSRHADLAWDGRQAPRPRDDMFAIGRLVLLTASRTAFAEVVDGHRGITGAIDRAGMGGSGLTDFVLQTTTLTHDSKTLDDTSVDARRALGLRFLAASSGHTTERRLQKIVQLATLE